MTMTRKDYEMIALSISVDRETMTTDEQRKVVDFIAKGLAEQLEAMNPRFDSMKFVLACGVNQ
jgi:hypothetical protein